MELGDKFIIINEAPYGMFSGHNEKPATFIEIEIIEKHHDSKGEFTEKQGVGYTAKGSDGFTYAYNYPEIHEGFSNTPWTRYISDEDFIKLSDENKDAFINNYIWSDLTDYQCPAKAKFAENKDFIDYCETHQKHFYKRKGCFYCKNIPQYRQNVEMNLIDHKWVGWY